MGRIIELENLEEVIGLEILEVCKCEWKLLGG